MWLYYDNIAKYVAVLWNVLINAKLDFGCANGSVSFYVICDSMQGIAGLLNPIL